MHTLARSDALITTSETNGCYGGHSWCGPKNTFTHVFAPHINCVQYGYAICVVLNIGYALVSKRVSLRVRARAFMRQPTRTFELNARGVWQRALTYSAAYPAGLPAM